jgi:heterotetrameric sarcosine oxidase delta subunit
MSIILICPTCGPRPIEEFEYGEIAVVPDSITDPDERDLDRAFMRSNPEGPQTERWFHSFGCRRWLTLRRDTRTDEVLSAARPTADRH